METEWKMYDNQAHNVTLIWLFSRAVRNVKSSNSIGSWTGWNLPFRTADSGNFRSKTVQICQLWDKMANITSELRFGQLVIYIVYVMLLEIYQAIIWCIIQGSALCKMSKMLIFRTIFRNILLKNIKLTSHNRNSDMFL